MGSLYDANATSGDGTVVGVACGRDFTGADAGEALCPQADTRSPRQTIAIPMPKVRLFTHISLRLLG
jgi:hypothetical protein